MQARIAFLERELDVRSEEIRRRDTIIMNMTETMKALNPPREEPSESPQPRSDSPVPPEDLGTPGSGTARGAWWRRMFGG